MKALTTIFGVLVFFAALGAALYGCYLAAGYLWNLYMELEATVRLVLLSSMATVIVASLLVAATLKRAVELGRKHPLVEARLELYLAVVQVIHELSDALHAVPPRMPTDASIRLSKLDDQISLLGSSAVIEACHKLQSAIDRQELEKFQRLLQQLVRAMRRDLGHGAGYDEGRLKFFAAIETSMDSRHPNHGVNL